MAISPVSFAQSSYAAKNVNKNLSFMGSAKDKDSEVKTTGGAGKAVASFFIPGLGQWLDDRKKEALGFFGSFVALTVANRMNIKSLNDIDLNQVMENGAKGLYKSPVLAGVLSVLGIGHTIYRVYDAYKGDRNEGKAVESKPEATAKQ